jgi:hypothetical protein
VKRCAFLSTEDLTDFVTDDELTVGPLQALGWRVDFVPWRAAVGWDAYDVVVVRTTWDYQVDAAAFDAALRRIDESRAVLCNPLPLMRWNMRKTYLRDLEGQGVRVLPTQWGTSPSAADLLAHLDGLTCDEAVIKPVVGANADHAWRVGRNTPVRELERIAGIYHGRDYLFQPFVEAVLTEGEFSLIYFDGEFSHAILKTPKAGDFRVQEEHGGVIRSRQPEPGLMDAGDRVLAAMTAVAGAGSDGGGAASGPAPPLYARADFVRTADDQFAIMELELIEPSLYFRMDATSPERFARAVDRANRADRSATAPVAR